MAPELNDEDRRGFVRRLEGVEKKQAELHTKVSNIEAEQRYVRQTIDSRYGALHEGQVVVVSKLDRIADNLNDAARFPAGKAILESLSSIHEANMVRDGKIEALGQMAARLDGALLFAKAIGVTAILGLFGVLVVLISVVMRLGQIVPAK